MKKANKGDWVQITRIILPSGGRAPQVPDDTKRYPLELWVKGFLQNDNANIGDDVEIRTITNRVETGKLCEINPGYVHTYGKYIPELTYIQRQLRDILMGDDKND